jgi:hypothetical protein
MRRSPRAALCVLVAACALAGMPSAAAGSTPAEIPPQGLYDACAPARSQDACASRLHRIGAAGFRAVLNGWVFNDVTVARIRAFAQEAAASGVQVIWPLNALPFQNADPNASDMLAAYPGLSANCGCSNNQGLLAYLVSVLRDQPNTWGYYLSDEPSPGAHDALATWVGRIRALDSSHPRLIMGCGICAGGPDANVAWMSDLDIALGSDAYPVFGGAPDPAHAYASVAQNVSSLHRIASAAGRREVVALQSWRWGDSVLDSQAAGVDPATTRFPSQGEVEAQRNAAVQNAHADLILWFTLTQVFGWESGQLPSGWTNPPDSDQRWANLVGGAFAPAPSVLPSTASATKAAATATSAATGAASRSRNRAPVARLVVRRSKTKTGSRVVADGARSRDPDGRIVRYVWTVNGKRKATCRAKTCRFRVDRSRRQRLTLTVVDDSGARAVARRIVR